MTRIHKDKEAGRIFNHMYQYQICGLELPDKLLNWAKENIPKMKLPSVIFIDTVKWLKEKYGIELKDGKEYGY